MSARRFFIVALVFAGGCSVATGSCQYKTAGACVSCSQPGLAHAPCPTGNAPGGEGQAFWYELKSLTLTTDAGLDLDCSNRPDAGPVLCQPVSGGNFSNPASGVDNSLWANTWSLRLDGGLLGDLVQAAMNREVFEGKWGALLIVDGWNGEPDDDQVFPRLLFSDGTTTGVAPRWDGSDHWAVPYSGLDGGLPDTDFAGGDAYVTHGQLVWDRTTALGASAFFFRNNALEHTGKGTAQLSLFDVVLFGPISKDGVSLTVSGGWSSTTAALYPNFLSGRDEALACELRAAAGYNDSISFGGVLVSDLPSPPFSTACSGTACSTPCGAISVAFGLSFVPTDATHVDRDNRDRPGSPEPECNHCPWSDGGSPNCH